MVAIKARGTAVRRLAVLCSVLLCGCSGGVETPETVPVSGTVMYNSQPVAGASVSFYSEGAPRAASGVTNEKGEFQLSTFGANDGAVVGEHVITVTKVTGEAAPANSTSTLDDPNALAQSYVQTTEGGQKITGPKNELPEKYATQKTTTLKETVAKDGANKFVLQLTD